MTVKTQDRPSAMGTRPEGARDEREAAARVQQMFSHIAPRYDFLNHFLSFSMDRMWRRRTAREFDAVLSDPNARVFDLCCGTGDLTFALERVRSKALRDSSAQRHPLIGGDFVQRMVERAQEKRREQKSSAVFVTSDAMQLPFPDACFDLVTTAFGFRNLANYENGLCEITRVLRENGQLGILEFSEPTSGALAGLFRFYFRRILPRIGGAIAGSREAYEYLPGSVKKFPPPDELTSLLQKVGFWDVRVSRWNFGSVVLHTARLAKRSSKAM